MRRFLSEQRGISAVIVVVSLFALMGAAMLSLDFGNMYQTRRNIVTGTDSAALQEAALASTSLVAPAGCSVNWTAPLAQNAGATTPGSCTVSVTRTTVAGVPIMGYVTVDAHKDSRTRFGTVVGVGDSSPYSLSAAQWGIPLGVTGLRPFGLCDQNPHYLEWLAYAARGYPTVSNDPYNLLAGLPDHPVYAGAGVVHRIYVDNDGGSCGQAPGNWAWLDYNSSSNPTNDQRSWWSNGYSPNVIVHSGPNCTETQAQDGDTSDGCVPGNTGQRGTSFVDQLNDLMASAAPIPIMIFSHLTGQGQISIFQTVAFLSVIVRGFDVHGNTRYLDLEFVRHDWGGICCNPDAAADTGARVVHLCDVDHDTTGASVVTRCS